MKEVVRTESDFVKVEKEVIRYQAEYEGKTYDFKTEEECIKFEKFVSEYKVIKGIVGGKPYKDVYTNISMETAIHFIRLIEGTDWREASLIWIDNFIGDCEEPGWYRVYKRNYTIWENDDSYEQEETVVEFLNDIKTRTLEILETFKLIEDGK